MIGVDTYSWRKILLLRDETKYSEGIMNLIYGVDLFLTRHGLEEFKYRFKKDTEILKHVTILPVLGGIRYKELVQEFDENDASLLEYCLIKGYRIVSEDRPMLMYGYHRRLNISPLIDFLFETGLKYDYFNKNEIYDLIRVFERWKNISKRKRKQLKKLVNDYY